MLFLPRATLVVATLFVAACGARSDLTAEYLLASDDAGRSSLAHDAGT
jgi:hypothetical protein